MTTPQSTEAKVEALMQVMNDHVRTLHILRQQEFSKGNVNVWMDEVKKAHATTRAAIALIVA